MKLWVFSDMQRDLNREGGFYPLGLVEADVCVVAGDMHPNLPTSVLSLAKISKRMPVVYVPGNRDYYGGGIEDLLEQARLAAASVPGKGIHILQDETLTIGSTRFIGATLWTDFSLGGKPEAATIRAGGGIADFSMINAWSPAEQIAAHQKSRKFIEQTLANPFEGETVVVTHHSPHPNSIADRFKDDRLGLNAAFHTDLSEILEGDNAPDLWIHGAVHSNFDYHVGTARVICNSRGYDEGAYRENPDFDPDLVIETSPLPCLVP